AAKDQALVYRLVSELIDTKRLSDASFAEGIAAFGEQGIVELGTVIGYRDRQRAQCVRGGAAARAGAVFFLAGRRSRRACYGPPRAAVLLFRAGKRRFGRGYKPLQ
ncbi:MAG TPA: hypothetical protein VGR70_08485, partial [Stellaceae bacterium]|nr:hypothetical protein [Stellaceae bacterium]